MSPSAPDVPGHSGGRREEPSVDYRFTLANERTFLAWVRTSLALLAGAVAIVQFAPDLGPDRFAETCAVLFAALAAACAAGGLWRWRSTETAMRRGTTLGGGLLPVVVAGGLALVALAVFAVLVTVLG